MPFCKLCNQTLPATPYRSVPTQVVETIARSRSFLQQLVGLARGVKVSKGTVYGGMGIMGAMLCVAGIAYLPCWANGCTPTEMRAAKALHPIEVSPTALYQEYAVNAEEADKRHLGKAILIETELDGDFTVNKDGALVVPLKAGVYAQKHQIWMEYDPKRADEIDHSNAFGNQCGQGGHGGPMKNGFRATFTCNGVNLSNPIGEPAKSVPYLYGCRLDTGAEWYYAKPQ
jgi:hypothetical protein